MVGSSASPKSLVTSPIARAPKSRCYSNSAKRGSANPDIRQMLAVIEASIQRLIPHDYATIALHDPSSPHQLHGAGTAFVELNRKLYTRDVIPLEGTPDGWVLAIRNPC